MLPVVILCGGLAKRMHPLTQTLPKSLLPIAGEPFIFHQLRLLQRQGLREVILCLGFLGEQIEAAVGDGSRFGLTIECVYEGEQLLGTAGALVNAQAQLPPQFFMLYGDSYLTCDFKAVETFFLGSAKLAVMTVLHNQDRWDESNVLYRDGQIMMYDKANRTSAMQHIDYGLSCFKRSIFEAYTPGVVLDLTEIYTSLIESQQLAGFAVSERFYEIGSFSGMDAFSQLMDEQGR